MSASHAVNNLITNETTSKEEQDSTKEFCSWWSLPQLYPEMSARCCKHKIRTPASGSVQPKKEAETKIHGREVTWLKMHWATREEEAKETAHAASFRVGRF